MSHAFPVPRLLSALLLGACLMSACSGEDSTTLVADARTKLAAGDSKAAMIQLKNAVAKDEKNAEARFELGKLYFSQLDLASAEKEFRRAREAGYPAKTVNPMIARALLGQREYQRVLDELPAPADSDPDSATLQALRAVAELGLMHTEAARKMLAQTQATAPDNPEVYLALAQLALVDHDPGKAMQDIDAALRIDPRHRDSLLLKGDLLRTSGKPAEAAAVYRQVLQIDPRHSGTMLALAGIAISENKLDEARKEVDAALKVTPNSLQARYTQALIDFREKKTEQARDRLGSVLKAAPDYAPALLLGGTIEYTLGNLQTAETYLNKVVKATPNNFYALRLLAASQLRLGRPDDAAATLAPALRSADHDAGVLIVAGEIALAKKDFAKASDFFEQATQRSPDSAAIRTELGISRLAQGDSRAMADLQTAANMEGASGRAGTFIILSQLEKKQFDAALTSIAALEKKQGANPLTWNYRGAAYLGKQDTVHARDSFEQALKLDPKFFPAAANLAQIDLKDKQPDAARRRFEHILKADPQNLNAMLALADLSLRNQDEKAYTSWLEKAASAHPQALQPRVALARYLLAKGDKNQALSAAREAVNVQPDNPAALDLLGTTQLALGDIPNALGSFRKLVERLPGQAAPLIKLATAQIVAKDMPTVPAGFTLEGDTAFARKDYAAALAAFERAQKVAPSGALLIRQLQVFDATQHPEVGEKRLADWLTTHPEDASTRAALAESLLKGKQYAAAAEHYLILNKSNPGNLLVLNNLAWTLSELHDKRALLFAEQALKLKPDNPNVLDTFGWLQVRMGNAAKGLDILKNAQSKAPDDATIQWHLAYALNVTGDKARARQELKALLDRRVSFTGDTEARALYQQLTVTP